MFHEQRLRIVNKANLDLSLRESVRRHICGGFIFTGHRSRTACSEAIPSAKFTSSTVIPTDLFHQNKGLPDVPEDDSSSNISNEIDSGFNNEELPTSSISSDESSQIEQEPDLLIRPFPGTIFTRTWDMTEIRKDPAYSFDSSSERQMSTASTLSCGSQRTIKRKGRCINLTRSVEKGKERASEKEGYVWEATGRSLSYVPRKAIGPHPQPLALLGSMEVKGRDLVKRPAFEKESLS